MAKQQNFHALEGNSKMQIIRTIRKGRIYRQTYGQKHIRYAIFYRCSISLKCFQNACESAV